MQFNIQFYDSQVKWSSCDLNIQFLSKKSQTELNHDLVWGPLNWIELVVVESQTEPNQCAFVKFR